MLGSLVDADADGAPTARPATRRRACARGGGGAGDRERRGAALLFPATSSDLPTTTQRRRHRAAALADDAAADGAAPPPDPDIEDELPPSTAARACPHWLAGDDAAEVSTLDLLAAADGAPRCALFVAADGAPWLAAARSLPADAAPRRHRPPARRRRRRDRGGGRRGSRRARPRAGGRRSGRRAGGALLVRPDGHVAWCYRAADGPPAEAEAAAQLEAALTRALRALRRVLI